MKKIWYRKLVRDKIPRNIKKNGSKYKARILSPKEFQKELIKKIGEESQEAAKQKSRQGLIQELGDVLDVIDEIRRAKKILPDEIKEAQQQARLRKGGFKKRLFLEWSSDDEYEAKKKKK